MYILWTRLTPKCCGDTQAHPSSHDTRLHRAQGGPDPPGQAGRALLRLGFQLGQADTSSPLPAAGRRLGEGCRRGRQPRAAAAPRLQEGWLRRGEEAPPAGPSPPQGKPRPGRAAVRQRWGCPTRHRGGLGRARPVPRVAAGEAAGRRAPPHLDLPTPLSPIMRIFRVVSTSSSIPSARPARPDPPPTLLAQAAVTPPAPAHPTAPFHAPPRRLPRACASGASGVPAAGGEKNTPAPADSACAEGRERSRPVFVYGVRVRVRPCCQCARAHWGVVRGRVRVRAWSCEGPGLRCSRLAPRRLRGG